LKGEFSASKANSLLLRQIQRSSSSSTHLTMLQTKNMATSLMSPYQQTKQWEMHNYQVSILETERQVTYANIRFLTVHYSQLPQQIG